MTLDRFFSWWVAEQTAGTPLHEQTDSLVLTVWRKLKEPG
jgi:hypothetical protein